MSGAPSTTRIPAVVFLAALALLALSAGVLMLRGSLPAVLRGQASWGYRTATAVVESIDIEGREGEHGATYRVAVAYRVAESGGVRGRDYLLHGRTYRQRADAEQAAAGLSVGGPVTIYEDPDDASRSVLTPGVPPRAALACAWAAPALGLGLVLGGLAAGMARSAAIVPTPAPVGPLGLSAGGLALSGALLIAYSRGVMSGWFEPGAWTLVGLWVALLVCWTPALVALRTHAPWRWL
jgi:hypothetical protein